MAATKKDAKRGSRKARPPKPKAGNGERTRVHGALPADRVAEIALKSWALREQRRLDAMDHLLELLGTDEIILDERIVGLTRAPRRSVGTRGRP